MTHGVADILRRIVDTRRERLGVAGTRGRVGTASLSEPLEPGSNPFLAGLSAARGRAVIAEIKMGSPRLGSLAGSFEPVRQARTYAEHGAAALSVVVEPDFFHGSYELLAECRRESGLPAIAKDFVVDERQLDWARQAGADAVLLIAALHHGDDLIRFAGHARSLGMAPLIETHDFADLEKLVAHEWELVGVNNRDLRTFEVSLESSITLLPELPDSALKVAESGIGARGEVERLSSAGFDAFLIGESLLLADDPGVKLRELLGVGRGGSSRADIS